LRTIFHEAYNNPDPDARVKFCMPICKEVEEMKSKRVWEVLPNEKIPK
jgi:hypothetical protein